MAATGYMTSYTFVVPSAAVARFLDINKRAAAIYLKHGALASTVLTLADGEKRHGCLGRIELLRLRDGEFALCVQDEFRDREHFGEVLAAVEAEPGIGDAVSRSSSPGRLRSRLSRGVALRLSPLLKATGAPARSGDAAICCGDDVATPMPASPTTFDGLR